MTQPDLSPVEDAVLSVLRRLQGGTIVERVQALSAAGLLAKELPAALLLPDLVLSLVAILPLPSETVMVKRVLPDESPYVVACLTRWYQTPSEPGVYGG